MNHKGTEDTKKLDEATMVFSVSLCLCGSLLGNLTWLHRVSEFKESSVADRRQPAVSIVRYDSGSVPRLRKMNHQGTEDTKKVDEANEIFSVSLCLCGSLLGKLTRLHRVSEFKEPSVAHRPLAASIVRYYSGTVPGLLDSLNAEIRREQVSFPPSDSDHFTEEKEENKELRAARQSSVLRSLLFKI